MRKSLNKPANRAKRFSRSILATLFVVTATVAIAAGTVVSRQQARATQASEAERSRKIGKKAKPVPPAVTGQEVEGNRQTGQSRELTAEEAQKLAGGLKQMVNQSTDGLVQVQLANGTVAVDLQDRFQSVTVARVNKDGSFAQSCVDNPKAAGAFFGIAPQLIDPTLDTRESKAARVSSTRKTKK